LINIKQILRKKFLKKYGFKLKRYFSFKKIYVSNIEIKHTNNKATISLYTYDKEKLSLLKKIRKLKRRFFRRIKLLMYKYKHLSSYDKYILLYLKKELKLIRKYKLKLNYNLYKFEESFLYKLSGIINKFYNKKVEFNIVNIKSIAFNSDIFTKIISLKLKARKISLIRTMNIILNKAKLPKVNRIIEKSRLSKTINSNLLENKFNNLNLNSILINNSKMKDINTLLKDLYSSTNKYISVFDSIKYKNMSGLRLEAKGRLTKRYRADRAIYKLR
jgi:hypothetical protein